MNSDLAAALLALIFFAAALGFWTFSWWTRDRPISLDAVGYSVIFFVAGLIVVIIWRITSDAPAR